MILPALATPSILAPTAVSAGVSAAQGGESAGDFGGTLASLLDGTAPTGPAPPAMPPAMPIDIAGRQPVAVGGKGLPGADMPVDTGAGVLPTEAASLEASRAALPPIWSPQTVAAGAPMTSPRPVPATTRAPDTVPAAPVTAVATDAQDPSPTPASPVPAKPALTSAIVTSLVLASPIAKALVDAPADAVPVAVPVPVPATVVAKPAVAPDRLVRAPRNSDRPAQTKPAVASKDTPAEPETETDTPAAPAPPVALEPIMLPPPAPVDPTIALAASPPAPAIVEETAGSAPPTQTPSIAAPQQLPVSPPPPRIAADVARAGISADQGGEASLGLASPEVRPAAPSAALTALVPVPATETASAPVGTPAIRELPAATVTQIGVARAGSTDRPRAPGPVLSRAIPADADRRASAIPFESGLGVVSIVEPAGQSRVQGTAPAASPAEPLALAPAPLAPAASTPSPLTAAADALPPRWASQEANPVMTLVAQQTPAPAQPLPGTVASAAQVFGAAIEAASRGRDEPAGPTDATMVGAPVAPAAIHAIAQTADAQTPLDMRQDRWPNAMIERIDMLRDAANASDTRIRLIPDALGAIDVSVRRDGDTVHVHFAAEQAATRTLLQDAQPRLTELADARGLKLSQASVDTGTSSGPGFGTGTGTGTGTGQQQQRAATPQQAPAPVRARARIAADTDSTDTRLA